MSLGRTLLLVSAVLSAWSCVHAPGAAQPESAWNPTERDLVAVVERQVMAYNAHDAAAFAGTYAADAQIYTFPDQPYLASRVNISEAYTKFFAGAPQVRATIPKRIVQGSLVIDHEVVTGIPGAGTVRAVVIYEVKQGTITRAWIAR